MTGGWGGLRESLADRWINLEMNYTGDVFSVVSGGLRRTSRYLGEGDVILKIQKPDPKGADKSNDPPKSWAGEWTGFRFLLHGIGVHGGDPSSDAGDLQGVDNLAAFNTWTLSEAYVEKDDFFNNSLSLLAGLYDLNSDFYALDSSVVFINSSHGIGFDFAQSGKNGPSIAPTTSLGLRIKVQPEPYFYAQGVVLDGVPGNPHNPHGTHIIFGKGDGVLMAAEFGYLMGVRPTPLLFRTRQRRLRTLSETGAGSRHEGKIGIGIWHYTAKFDDLNRVHLNGDPVKRRGSQGVYGLFERKITGEGALEKPGLSVFARIGVADPRVNRVLLFTGGGLYYKGVFTEEDELGFAVAAVHNGSQYRRAQANAGNRVDRAEVNFETTYLTPITKKIQWLKVQPDIQYVINPNTQPKTKNALVIGLRFLVAL